MDKFFGKWKVDLSRDEQWGANYLANVGYPDDFIQKEKTLPQTYELKKSGDQYSVTFTIDGMPDKTHTFRLGQPFTMDLPEELHNLTTCVSIKDEKMIVDSHDDRGNAVVLERELVGGEIVTTAKTKKGNGRRYMRRM